MNSSTELPNQETWMVTGAQGFLGANVGTFLPHRAKTIGIARSGSATYFHKSLNHELADATGLAADIETLRPDYLLHTAAVASHKLCDEQPELATAINAQATKILARACHQAGTKLIYISTDSVFSGVQTNSRLAGNYSESDVPDPNSIYGATKLQGEVNAQFETDPLIIRTNFYGWSPTHTRSILEFFVNSLSHNVPVQGFTNVITTSLYAQTLVNLIWQLKRATGVFHVTSRDALTKFEFGKTVAKEFGLPAGLISAVEAPVSKDISLNTEKLAKFLGIQVESQHQGIRLAREQQLWQRGVST